MTRFDRVFLLLVLMGIFTQVRGLAYANNVLIIFSYVLIGFGLLSFALGIFIKES